MLWSERIESSQSEIRQAVRELQFKRLRTQQIINKLRNFQGRYFPKMQLQKYTSVVLGLICRFDNMVHHNIPFYNIKIKIWKWRSLDRIKIEIKQIENDVPLSDKKN